MTNFIKEPDPKEGDNLCLHYYNTVGGYIRCKTPRTVNHNQHVGEEPSGGILTWNDSAVGDVEFVKYVVVDHMLRLIFRRDKGAIGIDELARRVQKAILDLDLPVESVEVKSIGTDTTIM